MGEGKWQVRYLHSTQTDKMITPVDFDKLYICDIIPRAILKKLCKDEHSKPLLTNLNTNPISDQVTYRKAGEENK